MSGLIRPLTKKDCAKGFHNFEVMDRIGDFMYEKCLTCGELETYDASVKDVMATRRWRERHKLDLLQPYGATLGDFVEYYGDVKGAEESEAVEVGPVSAITLTLKSGTPSIRFVQEAFREHNIPTHLYKDPIQITMSCCGEEYVIDRWKNFPLEDTPCHCGKNYYIRWCYEDGGGSELPQETK